MQGTMKNKAYNQDGIDFEIQGFSFLYAAADTK
jgi:hypothetical protein